MLTKKNLAKNSNAVVKNKHNFGFKNLEFDFFAVVGQFKFKKKMLTFFVKFFYIIPKIPPFSLLKNIPHFNFLSNNGMSIYNILHLRPCTLVLLQRSQNCFGFFINSLSSF
jgi:hypothetical protein